MSFGKTHLSKPRWRFQPAGPQKYQVALAEDPHSYAHLDEEGKPAISFCFSVLTSDGQVFTAFVSAELMRRRMELFRAGHCLWLTATSGTFPTPISPSLWVTDAWFDRGQDG